MSTDTRYFLRGFFGTCTVLMLGAFAFFTMQRHTHQEQAEVILESRQGAPQGTSEAGPEGPLGRLDVPRLKLSAVVEEGVGEDVLAVSIGHVPGTALPGSAGNAAFAAHRDTFFRPLKDLRLHDEINYTTAKGTYRYRVAGWKIVDPSRVDVLQPDGKPRLTLITCYPFYFVGHAPKRFVVEARPI